MNLSGAHFIAGDKDYTWKIPFAANKQLLKHEMVS